MMGRKKGTSLRIARTFGIFAIFAGLAFAGGRVAADDAPKPWVAPDDARKVKNPVPATPENLAAAETLFTDNCQLCHGEKGMGDGPGAKTIKVKPANFTDKQLMSAGNRRLAVLEDVQWPRPDAALEGRSDREGTLAAGKLHSQAGQGRREVTTKSEGRGGRSLMARSAAAPRSFSFTSSIRLTSLPPAPAPLHSCPAPREYRNS